MKLPVYGLLLLLLIPFQASLLAPFARFGLAPDLGLAVLYTIGLLTGPVEAALAGIAVGLLRDVASASPFGFSGLSLGIAGLGAGLLGKRVLDVQSPSNMLFLAVFSIAEALFTALFLEATYGSVPLLSLFFRRMVPRAAVTAAAGYWLLRLAARRNVLMLITRRDLQREL